RQYQDKENGLYEAKPTTAIWLLCLSATKTSALGIRSAISLVQTTLSFSAHANSSGNSPSLIHRKVPKYKGRSQIYNDTMETPNHRELTEAGDCHEIDRPHISEHEPENGEDPEMDDDSDGHSVASDESDVSVMESFNDYKLKIEHLLESIGLGDYLIEVIQHGYDFMNCVYSLTSPQSAEKYILRVATGGFFNEVDGRHETVEKEVLLLGYLKDKLPVPRIKAYSLTADNPLEAAYTVQTQIPGDSLNKLWATLDQEDKYEIVDEFVALLARLDAVQFARAGTFSAPASGAPPAQSHDFLTPEAPHINIFDEYATEPTKNQKMIHDRAGPDLKLLLVSHLEKWIQDEIDRDQHELSCAIGPRFTKLLAMLSDLETEGAFTAQPFPIVLHHCDLEPRNIMVSHASGAWKITGIIDWDDAVALPRPLARVPPRWIWHYPDEEPELEDGYLDDDQYRDPELSEENKALKAYFDTEVETVLPGYTEDAYGQGRWLRRIWRFAKEGGRRVWQWPFLDQLPEDWAARLEK
ncbi:MAG: hypothetical protein Q9195_008542, partial [Heterodermia aff. obscurata]